MTKTGHQVEWIEAEVGSGMNGSRSQLRRLLADPQVTTVVVKHRDRREAQPDHGFSLVRHAVGTSKAVDHYLPEASS